MAAVMKARRAELGLSQSELAAQVGTDGRQIRRYEAGETQPTLPVAKLIARALGISLDELAGADSRRVEIPGMWWSSWQTYKDGDEIITSQEVRMRQQGDRVEADAVSRGDVTLEEGGYLWRGELRLWDNEILMGWYAADDGAVRSKGTMYFVVHPHGQQMVGRWVGLSYDGKVVTGWAAMARDETRARELVGRLRDGTEVPA
jgi:transcriptional regulator with XRE-family HTH domain